MSGPDGAAGLPALTADGRARRAALAAFGARTVQPTSLVTYASTGQLLIVGPEPSARAAVESLGGNLTITVVAYESARGAAAADAPALESATWGESTVQIVRAPIVALTGHLGRFSVSVAGSAGDVDVGALSHGPNGGFDLVLDLSRTPQLRTDVLPPGYFAPGRDTEALHAALAELPELVGEFEKPQYVMYDPDICAHGARGLTGCTRCVDACPTLAIASVGERVAVDPYLCQGAGVCASACPTGALSYAYPRRSDTLLGMREALAAYAPIAQRPPCVLLHDAEDGGARLAALGPRLPEHVIPVAVEEIGTVGLEGWLAILAYGAARIALLPTPRTPASVLAEVRGQVDVCGAILDALGRDRASLLVLPAHDDATVLRELARAMPAPGAPATFQAFDEKRTTLRLALDRLYEQADAPPAEVDLPARAPFGRVLVNQEACTLCMACVAVCPVSALGHGEDRPQLDFREWNCVQCGLCETACPEQAVSREQRLVLDPERRREAVVLHEEEPFRCVECGKPFATPSIIERMTSRLAEHRMFQGDALRRIQMCEDCRVKDMMRKM